MKHLATLGILILLLCCKTDSKQQSQTDKNAIESLTVKPNGIDWTAFYTTPHDYPLRHNLKNKSMLSMIAPLKNISGERWDYCKFNAELEINFEHKKFTARASDELMGSSLARIIDDQIREQYALEFGHEKSNEHRLTFVIDKFYLDPEIFKHKPKKVFLTLWAKVGNSVGYNNHETESKGDLIYDKVEIDGW